jgi:putative transposase
MTAANPEAADVHGLCRLAGLSRASYYRSLAAKAPLAADAELTGKIQVLSLKHRHYGYRRITAELKRAGEVVNAKRVQRLMRADSLTALRRKPFIPQTTDSRHSVLIVPNLLYGLIPSAPDQVWVADITYVRLAETFAYLAVILDGFSRKVVGWAFASHLGATLAIEALDKAIAARQPRRESLIHHSDRGVQYACLDYRARLDAHAIKPSMSRAGNPYDNAKAESFMKTLKAEEVNGKAFRDMAHARSDICHFIDTVYNTERLHSALGYRPPIEFEQHFALSQSLQP